MTNENTSFPEQEDDGEHQHYFDDGKLDGDDSLRTDLRVASRSLVTTPWTLVQLTGDIAHTALDSVRYKKNYNKTVTTRLCLHFVNTVRQRVDSDLTWYLLSVDGCEVILDKTSTGLCDIYNTTMCNPPYTYELKLQQRTLSSSVYMVVSVFKVMTQKASGVIQAEASNLNFASYDDDDSYSLTLTQLNMHSESALSTTRDALPQRLDSLFGKDSAEFVLVSIGVVFGIVVAMVLARMRSSRAREAEGSKDYPHHINL